ncbi:helix-turn-helix domain-containing protein [uncultured Gilvimarinus sp.]|uniref:AraC family transcriptional regulator n=1 Tax=uncultured Gilvimarinus sp. TaxID=1689143 RepID=UPI0030EE32D8|tara:strand:- start:1070 stop:2212 length:1143 start_codon:yes stop_codon:yes gene_type:complete
MDARIFNVHDIFLIITIFEAILIASYRYAQPGSGKRASYLLVAFLIVVMLDMITNLIMWNPYFPIPTFVREHLLPLTFCLSHFVRGPLFYFYVRSLLYSSVPPRPIHLLHTIPALVAVIVVLATGLVSSDLQQRLGGSTISTLASFLWYSSSALSVAYAIWSISTLYFYMHRAKQHMSQLPGSEITWMAVLSVCFLISWAWSIVVVVSADLVGGVFADTVGTSHNFIRFLLMNGLIFISLIYTGRFVSLQSETHPEEEDVVSDEVLQVIEQGIQTQRLHLQPSINIDQFSEKIGLPVRTVSHAINRHLGTRFFEFINQHRIEEAKRLLSDPKANDMTILDVLLASGFNNKSSFHRFFNRLVGTSPSDFRRRAQHSASPAK